MDEKNTHTILSMFSHINTPLRHYIEQSILPRYKSFDAAHNENHIRQVIHDALLLSQKTNARTDMIFTIAAYHDIGIPEGRATHHITSARILAKDTTLQQWFSPSEIQTMCEAIEDHRASASTPPRCIYGCIVADADRDLEPNSIFQRTYIFEKTHHPQLSLQKQWENFYTHLKEKYGHTGYLKLYLNHPHNQHRRQHIANLIDNKSLLKKIFTSFSRE